MMELIVCQHKALAYIIRGTTIPGKTEFPTPPTLELQVGFVVYPAGGQVKPHRHIFGARHITRTLEVVIVKCGRCEVDVYNDDSELVVTSELAPGDIIVLVSGGHGFRMQEDTVLLEIKQGPYVGLAEKEYLK